MNKNRMLPLLSLSIGELGKRQRDEPLIASAEEVADALDNHGTRDELDEAMSMLNGAGRIRDALIARGGLTLTAC